MATFQGVYTPASPTATTLFNAVVSTGATATVTLATKTLFAIAVDGNCTIRFGNATKAPTATAADFPVFGNSIQEWETGQEFDRVSIFNNTAGNIHYWVYVVTRT